MISSATAWSLRIGMEISLLHGNLGRAGLTSCGRAYLHDSFNLVGKRQQQQCVPPENCTSICNADKTVYGLSGNSHYFQSKCR